jgi:hypothetical protein
MRKLYMAALLATIFNIGACTANTPADPARSAASPAASFAPVRVIVVLKSATDAASLQEVKQGFGIPGVSYNSQSGPTIHVLTLQPNATQSFAELMRQLRAKSAVSFAELDQKATI